MKKEDQHQQKNEEPEFSDASYQQDMRVDPLTTMDAIRQELREIESSRKARENEKKRLQKEKDEQNKLEFEEFLKQKRESGTESHNTPNAEGVSG